MGVYEVGRAGIPIALREFDRLTEIVERQSFHRDHFKPAPTGVSCLFVHVIHQWLELARHDADRHPAVVSRLGRELRWQKERDQALRAALSTGNEPATPSAETLEELRQLGYLED